MPINQDDLEDILIKLIGKQKIGFTKSEAVKYAALTGLCTLIGAVVDPAGYLIGGALGGLVAAWCTKGNVQQVFGELPDEKKSKILNEFQGVVSKLRITDLSELEHLVDNSEVNPIMQKLIDHGLRIVKKHHYFCLKYFI